ncbi:MAG: putative transcriptional regulator [Candidatus Azotimanducaceae bacterium]|jgi:putative transcriptional regulator
MSKKRHLEKLPLNWSSHINKGADNMKDELFAELMASAEEMVAIENGSEILDVKSIREAAGKTREEFALIIGSSEETVKSWENKRRNPSGASKKLLYLIQTNPAQMIELLQTA